MAGKHTIAQLFKRHYCHCAFTDCARHMMFSYIEETSSLSEEFTQRIGELMPTLSPNQSEKVRKLLSS